MAIAKKGPLDVDRSEAASSDVCESPGKKLSGVRRVSPKVQSFLSAANIDDLGWEIDEDLTPVQTPDAIRDYVEKEALIAQIGEMNLGDVRVSFQDLQIWIDIQSGIYRDLSRMTQLIPRVAKSLVEAWEKPDLILGSLETMDCSLAREFAEWEGNVLHFPGVQFTEPGALEILEQAKAQKVIVGNGIIKIPTRE